MAARLQHQLHDIAVSMGTFLIGRGSDCQLALDDPLVSRRHATIRLDDDGRATLEDMGSRNGVLLNGVRIDKPEPLTDGDLIRIGSQDIGFFLGEEPGSHPASRPRAMRVTMQELPLGIPESVDQPDTAKPSSLERRKPIPGDDDDLGQATHVGQSPFGYGAARMANGLTIIGSVAEKALALGRADDGARILQRTLTDILDRAGKGEVDAELAERAASYAIRLATATARGAWIEYVFQLYTSLRALPPARLVDELYAAVRKVKHADKAVLRAYTARLREASANFGPAERFIQQRIEGLERMLP
jgi:hypothetical protein